MLSWNVLFKDFNKKEIVYYDIFKSGYYEELAKEINFLIFDSLGTIDFFVIRKIIYERIKRKN